MRKKLFTWKPIRFIKYVFFEMRMENKRLEEIKFETFRHQPWYFY